MLAVGAGLVPLSPGYCCAPVCPQIPEYHRLPLDVTWPLWVQVGSSDKPRLTSSVGQSPHSLWPLSWPGLPNVWLLQPAYPGWEPLCHRQWVTGVCCRQAPGRAKDADRAHHSSCEGLAGWSFLYPSHAGVADGVPRHFLGMQKLGS